MNKIKLFIKSLFLSSVIFFSVVFAASVSTDTSEYKFGETVTIYGIEFTPNVINALIEVTNPNDETIFQKDVSTDQNGNFTTIYSLPAQDQLRIEGNYTLYVILQSNWVYTTFYVSGLDETPPTFFGSQSNETEAEKPCEFKLTWNDNKALHPLGHYRFSTNNSGDWMTTDPINFTSTPQTISYVITLRDSEGLVKWKFIATDNASNSMESDSYEVDVVTTVPCNLQSVEIGSKCSGGNYTECEPNEKIEVNATYSGDCPDPAFIQVNANGTDCFICDQGRDTCDDDICNMTGISVECQDSPCSEEWEIPPVTTECQGKLVNSTNSYLYSDYPCAEDSEMKDEVTPTGSFTFYLVTTTTSTTTSTTSTTTVVTTTSPTTTSPVTTTSDTFDTTSTEEGGSSTYWIIAIVIIFAVVGVFVWFKFLRTTEEDEFQRLKEKWSR